MDKPVAIQLKNITKTFGSVVANENVDMDVREGEILAILGENGSGKTTLMNMIAGIYYPDEGHIYIKGEEVSIRSPKDAFAYKIGMIHQHFKLIDVFSASENIVLGIKDGKYKLQDVNERVREMCERYGFAIDPNKKIYEMSVSEKQTVEIIKVLYRGADILILDEPTAVLTPQETENSLRCFAGCATTANPSSSSRTNCTKCFPYPTASRSSEKGAYRHRTNVGNERNAAYRNDGGQENQSEYRAYGSEKRLRQTACFPFELR